MVPGHSIVIDGIAWPVQGAQVAVVDRGRILLQLRPWPPGWELPGGHCEPGEAPEVTAAREVREETGYDVGIERVVGVYTWGGLRSAGDVLYLASITGGGPRRSLEAWALRLVPPQRVPRTTFPWMRRRIEDAFAAAAGAPPVHRLQPVTLYHVASFGTAWMRAPLDRLVRARRR